MLWLLLLVGLWPLLGAALVQARRLWWLPTLGALPGLAAALLVPLDHPLELPWLVLGTTLELDALGRVYLLFTALLWTFAGVHAAYEMRAGIHARRFASLFLLAMSGNLWLIVAQDLANFYLGFALMGLSSYGLVIHSATPANLHAGQVYLVMALLGEVTLFVALVLIAQQLGGLLPSPEGLAGLDDLSIALVLLGLGVKAGMAPLHLWLPLAHPAAPVAASAVLSGAMIKVALLGWLRLLPIGVVALPEWSAVLTVAGLATLALALAVGLVQSDPKVILAYSSVAKMGFLILMLGVLLAEPELAPVGVAGLSLYIAHHALVKGGLFLGVGLRKSAARAQVLILLGLGVLALALAGAPLSSGAVAKDAIKPLLASAQWPWIASAVALSAFATTLLMARFLWVMIRLEPHPAPGYGVPGITWGLLLGLVVLFPFVLGAPAAWVGDPSILIPAIVTATGMLMLTHLWPALARVFIARIPPGDLLALLIPPGRWAGGGVRVLIAGLERVRQGLVARLSQPVAALLTRPTGDVERNLRHWPLIGLLWVGIGAGLVVGLLWL